MEQTVATEQRRGPLHVRAHGFAASGQGEKEFVGCFSCGENRPENRFGHALTFFLGAQTIGSRGLDAGYLNPESVSPGENLFTACGSGSGCRGDTPDAINRKETFFVSDDGERLGLGMVGVEFKGVSVQKSPALGHNGPGYSQCADKCVHGRFPGVTV
jgi:hypothetical protein